MNDTYSGKLENLDCATDGKYPSKVCESDHHCLYDENTCINYNIPISYFP